MTAVLSNINLFVRDIAVSRRFYLFVRDIAVSRRFYVEVIGLTEDERMSAPPSFVGLLAGDNVTISLQDASAPGFAPSSGGSESVEIGFAVDDVEAVRARLVAWGAGDVSAVQQMGWGEAVDARDPDNHRLTIFRRCAR